MPLFTDQTGHSFELHHTPQRIISLVPSLTELLADLRLSPQQDIVGITKFCIHPDELFRSRTRVGGTKQVKIDLVHQLEPDLIIANKEENVKEQVEELARHYPVYISDVNNLEDAYKCIQDIGEMTDTVYTAGRIIEQIKDGFSQIEPSLPRIKVCYLIWKGPFMTVGRDTFIHDMMDHGRFDNAFAHLTRYPQVTIEDIKASDCKAVFLSSEPYPFNKQHYEELKQLLPGIRIVMVDGEMFSWYGSRLRHSALHFRRLHYGPLEVE